MKTACQECGALMHPDEEGLCEKLIGRDTEVRLCIDCLGKRFGVSREDLERLIIHYRRLGCQLFSPWDE